MSQPNRCSSDNCLTVTADVKNITAVLSYVEEDLAQKNVAPKIWPRLITITEEVFSNIAQYAYSGSGPVNIETSLNVPKRLVEMMKGVVDHWIVDIKDMNPIIYKAYTGKDIGLVIDNLQYLTKNNSKITVRVPHIPGFNTASDVEKSISSLQEMGITDIERFTYIVKQH